MPNIFAKFSNGIDGESTVKAHEKEVEILSIGFGASQPTSGTRSSSGGASTSSAQISDVMITKYVDSASPLLMKHCIGGTHIDTVDFSFHRAAKEGETVEYMEIKLTNSLISGVSLSGVGDGDIPTENISIDYGQIEVKYVPQKRAGGGGSGNVPFSFNAETLELK